MATEVDNLTMATAEYSHNNDQCDAKASVEGSSIHLSSGSRRVLVNEYPEFEKKLRHIPYRYDAYGSYCFDQVTQSEDYYLTRKEQELIDNKLSQVLQDTPQDSKIVEIVELGCGMGKKTISFLNGILDHVRGQVRYVPVDVSEYYLEQVYGYLQSNIDSDRFSIQTYCGDYHQYLKDLNKHVYAENGTVKKDNVDVRIILFLGSSLGNYQKEDCVQLLTLVSDSLRKQDMIIIGIDTPNKPKKIIERAYTDRDGWFSELNFNALKNINANLGCFFDLENFKHEAKLIGTTIHQMVVAQRASIVQWNDVDIIIPRNYELTLCVSDKFDRNKIMQYFGDAGMYASQTVFTDDDYYMLAVGKRR